MPTPLVLLLLLVVLAGQVMAAEGISSRRVDVCVYGATPAGILAAIAAKQEGSTVVLIDPSRWPGGILGAGIKPLQDCAEPKAVGGLTKKVVFAMGKGPDLIRGEFTGWMAKERIPLIYEHRVQRVEKRGATISRLFLEWAPPDATGIPAPVASWSEATVYIDASDEGGQLAGAKVPYAVGRKAYSAFDEQRLGSVVSG